MGHELSDCFYDGIYEYMNLMYPNEVVVKIDEVISDSVNIYTASGNTYTYIFSDGSLKLKNN